MTFINQLHGFLRTGYGLMMRVENRDELLDKCFSFFENVFPETGELLVINGKGVVVENKIQGKNCEDY